MNEHRRQILDMLASGRITADEADRLIGALGREQRSGSEPFPKSKAKYLRVLVEDEEDRDSPMKVNIRVPMQLLRAGVKLTGLIPAQARVSVNAAMREHGMFFDLNELRPENLEEMIEQLSELSVDVGQEGQRVRVYFE